MLLHRSGLLLSSQSFLPNPDHISIAQGILLKPVDDLVQQSCCNNLKVDIRDTWDGPFLLAWSVDEPWLGDARLDCAIGLLSIRKDLCLCLTLEQLVSIVQDVVWRRQYEEEK